MSPKSAPPTPPERFDPHEIVDLNRYPPVAPADLAIQQMIRNLAVPAAPPEDWKVLLDDLADRTPATRAAQSDLARRLRDLTPPAPAAADWAARGAALEAHLAARAGQFAQQAAWLDQQIRALPVPPATSTQWAGRAAALEAQTSRRTHDSERLEKITRDAPVPPTETTPDMRQSDWNAVEATLRRGRHDAPPAVDSRRWDALWNRIRQDIQPAASNTTPPGPATPSATVPRAIPLSGGATATASSRRRPWKLFFTGFAAAAALALLALGLSRLVPGGATVPPTIAPPAPATLASAEILDMGDVDQSLTSVVRTTSGTLPVTVVVIISQ